MNRSFSKIRHIQESNLKLEKRLLREQDNESETAVQEFLKSGYKVVDKINLPDGTYNLTGSYNKAHILYSQKYTGYVIVIVDGIRGSFDNERVDIKGGKVDEGRFYDVYKLLYNDSEKGKSSLPY